MTLKNRGGCVIGGRAIWNLRCADDTTLLATSPEELQHQSGKYIDSAKSSAQARHRQTDRQTDGKLISTAERSLRNARWNVEGT